MGNAMDMEEDEEEDDDDNDHASEKLTKKWAERGCRWSYKVCDVPHR